MLQFICEQHGLSLQTIAEATGIANSKLWAVIHCKRRFTRDHIQHLAKLFKCSSGVFAG